jgi:hypothetical protein
LVVALELQAQALALALALALVLVLVLAPSCSPDGSYGFSHCPEPTRWAW